MITEGTTAAITMGLGGHFEEVEVTGPLGKKIIAKYGVIKTEKEIAIIEISAAAGLPLIPEIERDPMKTTTYGVGEMIKHALDKG